MADVERQAEQMPWGHCGRGTERIIEAVDTVGADNVQISLNRVAFLLRRGAITRSGRRVRCQERRRVRSAFRDTGISFRLEILGDHFGAYRFSPLANAR